MADFPDKIPTSGKKSPVIPTSPAENAAGKAPDYKVGYGKPPKHSQYKEGESGNEKGRPRGSRNRLMELTDAMLEGSAEEIMQRVLELARNGDKAILVKCFERLVPRPRERPVSIQMPPVNSAADRANAVQAIIAQAAAGEIALSEAERFVRLIDIQIEAIETSEHARVADELLQSRGSGIARLAPESDGALVGDNRAPATEINGESAADPVAPEAGTGASASNGASSADEEGPKNYAISAEEDAGPKTSDDPAGHYGAPKDNGASPGDERRSSEKGG